jgi:NADPH:quinone reductase-like Zn-dependent oxidoreductase/acyl carrier protein
MGRVLANEHPELEVRSIDLGAQPDESEISLLLSELVQRADELEVALRGSDRYVHRVVQIQQQDLATQSGAERPFRLRAARAGAIEQLRATPLGELRAGPGQVEIELYAAGLNFKDLANLTGLLPDELVRDRTTGEVIVGQECSGVVVAVGAGVTNLTVGQEVMGYAPCSLGTRSLADARMMVPKPPQLDFEEAATTILVFGTVLHALRDIARLERGETVLIHSAAGGIGLAAIQLARELGAQVIATAGTASKRDFLKAIGIEHVFDSRSLEFVADVLRVSQGRGVDVVVNSLAGVAMEKSLSLVAPFGRFLELGKRDIGEGRRIDLSPFLKSISYFGVALDLYVEQKPDYASRVFHEVGRMLADGRLHAIPFRTYAVSETHTAFRHMAQGRHLGKLVISLRDGAEHTAVVEPSWPPVPEPLSDAGTYLITGGLGGFGLAVADRLVKRGARHLVLLGRSGAATAEAQQKVDALVAQGAYVEVVKADISRESEVKACLDRIRKAMPPLRGVVHGAMVLDDGVILRQDRERFQRVLGPKVLGAWWLHQHTLTEKLDFFVLFSSFTSVVGNPGQVNYVAANSFLDAFAGYRRRLGLPGLTLNWGVLSDVGYVAQNEQIAQHLLDKGAKAITSREALDALEALLPSELANVLVQPGDWDMFAEQIPVSGTSPRFRQLLSSKGTSSGTGASARIGYGEVMRADAEGRLALIELVLVEQVAKVMATAPSKIDSRLKLTDLGLDSLMAVELRNLTMANLRVDIPTTKILGGNTILELVQFVNQQLAPAGSGGAGERGLERPTNAPASSAMLEALSDDELDQELTRLLLEAN